MMARGRGDRAWWVIESVFFHSPDKGFCACLYDLPLDMSRRPETWVPLCKLILETYNLMLEPFAQHRYPLVG